MPLKSGGVFETMVLFPGGLARELLLKLPLAFASPRIDVAVKRQNTERFLRRVAQRQAESGAFVVGGGMKDAVEHAR